MAIVQGAHQDAGYSFTNDVSRMKRWVDLWGGEWGNRTQVVVDLLLVCSSCIYGSITPPHVFVDQFLYSTWAYTWINDQSLTILNCFFALINTWRGGGGLGGSGWSRFRICGNSFLKWNARSSHQRWNENTADALLKCNVDCIAKVLKLSDKMSRSSLPQTAKSRHPLIKSTSMDDGILSVPNIYEFAPTSRSKIIEICP